MSRLLKKIAKAGSAIEGGAGAAAEGSSSSPAQQDALSTTARPQQRRLQSLRTSSSTDNIASNLVASPHTNCNLLASPGADANGITATARANLPTSTPASPAATSLFESRLPYIEEWRSTPGCTREKEREKERDSEEGMPTAAGNNFMKLRPTLDLLRQTHSSIAARAVALLPSSPIVDQGSPS
jgi:hypothetical protein